MDSERHVETRSAHHLSVGRLRTEEGAPFEDRCPLCDCTKSGWYDVPNMVSEWCDDLLCRCHEDDD